MKSISRLIRHLNAYMSLLLHIWSDRNSPILAENNNASNYFKHHNEEEYSLDNKMQDIEEDQRDSIGKSLDNESIKNMLLERTP